MGRQLCAVAHGQLRSGARPDVYIGGDASQPRRGARQLHATVGNNDLSCRGAGARQPQHAGADVVQRAGAADVAGVVDGVASVEDERRVIDDIARDRARGAALTYLQRAPGYRRSARVRVVASKHRGAQTIDLHGTRTRDARVQRVEGGVGLIKIDPAVVDQGGQVGNLAAHPCLGNI
ncbi:hypothetical protein D3C73_1114420 [compost metagenome]